MEQVTKEKTDWSKLQSLPIIGADPTKKYTEKEEKHLRELVNYEFMNIEEPGLSQTFPYGNTNNHRTFTFAHGSSYRVPRFLARHVESKSTPIWGWEPDGSGSMRKKQKGSKSRFQMREVYD